MTAAQEAEVVDRMRRRRESGRTIATIAASLPLLTHCFSHSTTSQCRGQKMAGLQSGTLTACYKSSATRLTSPRSYLPYCLSSHSSPSPVPLQQQQHHHPRLILVKLDARQRQAAYLAVVPHGPACYPICPDRPETELAAQPAPEQRTVATPIVALLLEPMSMQRPTFSRLAAARQAAAAMVPLSRCAPHRQS